MAMEELKNTADRVAMAGGVTSPLFPWASMPSLSTIVSALSLFWMILRMSETKIVGRTIQRIRCRDAKADCAWVCPHECPYKK